MSDIVERRTMKIASDHGFPKPSFGGYDPNAFDAFKNERDYIAQGGRLKNTVAAMDWAADEIERLLERCEAYKGQVKAGSEEIERLRASETAWRLIAKGNDKWNALPQSEKEAATEKALASTIEDLAKAEDEIERLQAAKREALKVADERSIQNCDLRAENERLKERLSAYRDIAEKHDNLEAENERLRAALHKIPSCKTATEMARVATDALGLTEAGISHE